MHFETSINHVYIMLQTVNTTLYSVGIRLYISSEND